MTGTEKRPSSDTGAFETLQGVLRVSLIATPRAGLETCRPDESIATVQRRNTKGYDYLPVVEDDAEDAAIIGLFHARRFQATRSADEIVRDNMDNLSEANLIGADASILDFGKVLQTISPSRIRKANRRVGELVRPSETPGARLSFWADHGT